MALYAVVPEALIKYITSSALLRSFTMSEEQATVAAKELLEQGDAVFHRAPLLKTLRITEAAGLLEALAQLPHLGRLTTLGLSDNRVLPAEARSLAQSPHLAHLQELIMHNCALGDEGLREFALSSTLAHLRQWFLTDNGLTDDGLAILADSPRFPNVASLCFGHYGVSPVRYDSITRQGLLRLASSPQLTSLAAIHWYELTARSDVPYEQTSEALLPVPRTVRLVTHVEQIW
jgi:hypothetical protein